MAGRRITLAPVELAQPRSAGWREYVNEVIASEISSFSRYFNQVIQWKVLPHDSGVLFDRIDCVSKRRLEAQEEFPDLTSEDDRRSLVVLNGTLNHNLDIQGMLSELWKRLSRSSRVVIVAYNPYLRALYRMASRLGIRQGEEPYTFVTHVDLGNIAKLSGYEVVKVRNTAYCPLRMFGVGSLINRIMPLIPLFKSLSFTSVIVLRPIRKAETKPTLSIVIPARNERGNIRNAVTRLLAALFAEAEVIFVEGHSSDGTWEEIEKVVAEFGSKIKLKAFRQRGKGKNDAVRLGFSHATGDVLTILDADLTMPPEMLERFYEAYRQGLGDFINGNRLVYPKEGEAMRFLNHLGNVFFAKALSSVLGVSIGDSLCGTKLVSRTDYQRFIAWRRDFGDFDPFGDFELIFPAAALALGIVDVPIYYRARMYGSTNITRFRHGLMLLKMTLIGLFRIRLGRV